MNIKIVSAFLFEFYLHLSYGDATATRPLHFFKEVLHQNFKACCIINLRHIMLIFFISNEWVHEQGTILSVFMFGIHTKALSMPVHER